MVRSLFSRAVFHTHHKSSPVYEYQCFVTALFCGYLNAVIKSLQVRTVGTMEKGTDHG